MSAVKVNVVVVDGEVDETYPPITCTCDVSDDISLGEILVFFIAALIFKLQ